jgi:hypothetical protein
VSLTSVTTCVTRVPRFPAKRDRTRGRRFSSATALFHESLEGSQVGGFLHTNVVPLLACNERRVVLYVGHLELAGKDIEGNTERVLVREAGPPARTETHKRGCSQAPAPTLCAPRSRRRARLPAFRSGLRTTCATAASV